MDEHASSVSTWLGGAQGVNQVCFKATFKVLI